MIAKLLLPGILLSGLFVGKGPGEGSLDLKSPIFSMAVKDTPQVVPGGYCTAESGFSTYLHNKNYYQSLFPLSYFVAGKNTVSAKKPAGSLQTGVTLNFVFGFSQAQLIAHNAMTISVDYLDTDNETHQAVIEVTGTDPKTVHGTDANEGALRGQFMSDGYFRLWFTPPASASNKVDFQGFSITMPKGMAVTNACGYLGPDYQGFIPLEEQPCKGDEFLLAGTNEGKIEAKANRPVMPYELLNAVIAYDEEDKKYYRPKPADDSYEAYAAAIPDIQSGDVHSVKLMAMDSDSNVSFFTIHIHYVDYNPPVITVGDDDSANLRISYEDAQSQGDLIAAIKSYITVTDDVAESIVPVVELKGDFDPEDPLGSYDFKVMASDGLNSAERNGTADVVDDVGPDISGPKKLTVSVSHKLEEATILAMYSAYDDIDGEITNLKVKSNEYKGNETKEGTHKLVLTCSDKAGNVSDYSVDIVVGEADGPVWYIVEGEIHIVQGSSLSPLEVVRRLVDEGTLEDRNYQKAEIVSGPAIDAGLDVGTHEVQIKAENKDGHQQYVKVTVNVMERTKMDLIPAEKNGFFQWIIDFFNSIGEWFKNLFGIK